MRIVGYIVLGVAFAVGTVSQSAPRPKAAKPPATIAEIQAPQALIPHAIPSAGLLSAADLVAIAQLTSKGSEDQFSDAPSPLKYVGRNFTIVLASDVLSVSYNKEEHKLTVSTSKYSEGWILDKRIVNSTYTGQNAYGAKAEISKKRGDTWGVEIPGPAFDHEEFIYMKTIDGPSARDFSKFVSLRVTGKIKNAEGIYAEKNSVLSRHYLITEATVSTPLDVLISQWLIAVNIEKAEWIDSRTGEILSPN